MVTWSRLYGVCASALALMVGCASEDAAPQRGQLMIAISTDMSVPKDIDHVHVQVVLTRGPVVHDQTYWIEPARGGDTLLPATLAVVAGDSANASVELRVTGFLGDEARTFSKVQTTIPESRLATVRVPVQWLCDGSAQLVVDDIYDSACSARDEEEYSCVAGTCEPASVDVASLPDFDPAAIFGGGEGPGDLLGECFDTIECFDAGEDVAPEDDCELDVDVPSGGELNVALKFPADDPTSGDSPGICGSQGCYVPLDKDDRFGWRSDDAGTVQLPPAACAAVAAGAAQALRVCYTHRSKTAQFPSCGPWSSVGED
ncbi:MAG TPA: hypothetical protein VI197_35085 [Polyangiaceae bacterium]